MRAAAAAAVVCAAALVLLVTLTVRPERVALEGKAARARGARPTARSIELTAKTALKQLEGKTKSKNAPLPASAASAAQVISASVKAALSKLAGKPTASPSQAAADVAARADAKAAKRVKSDHGAPKVEPGPPAASATEVQSVRRIWRIGCCRSPANRRQSSLQLGLQQHARRGASRSRPRR